MSAGLRSQVSSGSLTKLNNLVARSSHYHFTPKVLKSVRSLPMFQNVTSIPTRVN